MANEKTLLKEEAVRRFMKLAEIATLTDSFLENKVDTEEELNEMGGDVHAYKDDEEEAPLGTPEEVEADLEMDAVDDLDAAADLDAPEDVGMDVESKLRDFFDAVAQAATDILGVDTSVESDEAPAAVDPMGAPEEEDVEVELDADLGTPEGEEELEEASEENTVDRENLVQEIASRVAQRLLKKD